MTLPQRPAPEVRVSDPRAPLPPPPAAGPVRQPRRRGALPLVLLLVALAAAAGLVELRQAQRERAASAVLDLRLDVNGSTYASAGESSGAGRVLRRELALRNGGGRAVELLGAELVGGAMASRGSSRVVGPGDSWSVVLAGAVRCAGGPPRFAPSDSFLRVRAVTGVGERSVDLAVPPVVLAELQSTAERTCAAVPVRAAVRVDQTRWRVVGGQLLLDLELAVAPSAPVDLVRVVPALPGIRVTVRSGKRPAVLPLRLGAAPVRPRPDGALLEGHALRLVVSVASCDVLRRAIGGSVEVLESALLVDLTVAVQGRDGEGVTSLVDTGGLPRLLSAAC